MHCVANIHDDLYWLEKKSMVFPGSPGILEEKLEDNKNVLDRKSVV